MKTMYEAYEDIRNERKWEAKPVKERRRNENVKDSNWKQEKVGNSPGNGNKLKTNNVNRLDRMNDLWITDYSVKRKKIPIELRKRTAREMKKHKRNL